MSNIKFPMIITCFVENPTKLEKIFARLLRESGYVQIGKDTYIHEGGEQLTAAINYGKTFFPESKEVRDCLTLYLSAAEHPINSNLCNELNKVLSSGNAFE